MRRSDGTGGRATADAGCPLRRDSRLGRRLVAALAALLAATGPASARAAFPPGPPNDPDYAPAEDPSTNALCDRLTANQEQRNFYSFVPRCTPNVRDPDNASGMSVDRAWRDFGEIGRPDVLIAYIEGGINWHDAPAELADKVYINVRELPVPCVGSPCVTRHSDDPAAYDVDHDGVVTAADYARDPRVSDVNHNGIIDPEDVIAAFTCYRRLDDSLGTATYDAAGKLHCSNGAENVDNDHDGYPHDISGWDFYDGQNDPATVDSAYTHANDQQRRAAAETNNGILGAGLCPRCLLLPIKAGAEALDRTDDLAQAWLFAADSGASVIVSVTADLGYSSFMRQAVEEVWRRGIVAVESSNDFDSVDHQGGMFWPHVIPGNGLVSNTEGIPTSEAGVDLHDELLVNRATTSYIERSDQTSWGPHTVFSAATVGGSTSESTPTLGGVLGLVLSYGRDAAAQHLIGSPLTGPEAVQVLRETATRITDATLDWPGAPGEWNVQYGYGRPNVARALQAIHDGAIPPVGWISSPDWYSWFDPTQVATVAVTGHVEARRSPEYRWILDYAPGAQPDERSFVVAGTGTGTAPFDGRLGTIDLRQLPSSFASVPFSLSRTKELETSEQYTVTVRLRVVDAVGRIGEDRRTIEVRHDPTLLPHFPLHLGHGGESQPALVDLQGRGHLAIVLGDSDGVVHAIDPATGRELPGWPVTTDPVRVVRPHRGIDPGHEPIIAPVAVGDLDHTGDLSVVATSTSGKVYVFDANGRRRPGWPRIMDRGVVPPPVPRPPLPHTRLPARGAGSGPVLADLDGDGHLEILQSGWDGFLHVWRPGGTDLPGWPVEVRLPPGYPLDPGHILVEDRKIETSPVVADLDGDGRPEIVVKNQETEILGDGIQPLGVTHLFAYQANGKPVAGWPVKLRGIIEYYGSAQEFITEGVEQPIAGDVSGSGRDSVAAAPVFSPTVLVDGSGRIVTVYGPLPDATASLLQGQGRAAVSPDHLPTDAPISFTTAGAFGRMGGRLVYAQSGSGAATTAASLLLVGSGVALQNVMRAYDALAGASVGGFPAPQQGLAFLGEPIVTDVVGDGGREIVATADSAALAAYGSGGTQAPGFPKFHTGWGVWSPSAGDLLSDGHVDVVEANREGYLFAWRTPGRSDANDQWWTYQHDEWRTGRYGVDSRPPGVVRDAEWHPGEATLRFTAPGDDWYTGTPAAYLLTLAPTGSMERIATSAPAGTRVALPVPAGTTGLRIQAIDKAGNIGRAVELGSLAQSTGAVEGELAGLPSTGRVTSTNGSPGAGAGAVAFLALIVPVLGRRRRQALAEATPPATRLCPAGGRRRHGRTPGASV